jgi:hypothetical protein
VVYCAPDDGCRYDPKQVEQFPDKINSVTCASCWDLYTRILLRCTDPQTLNSSNFSHPPRIKQTLRACIIIREDWRYSVHNSCEEISIELQEWFANDQATFNPVRKYEYSNV